MRCTSLRASSRRYGGNGAVGIFLTATLKVPVKDFVLKTNTRRS